MMNKLQFFDIPLVLTGIRKSKAKYSGYSHANHVLGALYDMNRWDLAKQLRKENDDYGYMGKGCVIPRKHYKLICEKEWVDELFKQVTLVLAEHSY